MNFVKQRKNWPAIRARWPVLEKPLIQPETVLIVTIALCLTGCVSHRKSMNREVRTESASADSANRSRRAGLVMAGIQASAVQLTIAADSFACAWRRAERQKPEVRDRRSVIICVFVLLTGTVAECALVPRLFAWLMPGLT